MSSYSSIFEKEYIEILVEFFLLQRDTNSLKKDGHIWGITSLPVYRRFSDHIYQISLPKQYSGITNILGFKVSLCFGKLNQRQEDFLQKHHLFDKNSLFSEVITQQDRDTFPFIALLGTWYQSGFSKYVLSPYKDSLPIISFLHCISQYPIEDYYFNFGLRIQKNDIDILLKTLEKEEGNFFVYYALVGYFFELGEFSRLRYYLTKCLNIDKYHPGLLLKISQLKILEGDMKSIGKTQKILKFILQNFSNEPWVYQIYGNFQNSIGNYQETLNTLCRYEKVVDKKFRTFEPFLFRGIAKFELGDVHGAKRDFGEIENYYFGEGFRFIYNKYIEMLNKTL